MYRVIGDEEFEVEAGFPVSAVVEGDEHVHGSSLPAGPAAITWHIGPYDKIGEAYEALSTWITENGGVPDGPGWEIYFSDPGTSAPADYRTQVVQPYTTE
jgi:effector-binding domain-containing protein